MGMIGDTLEGNGVGEIALELGLAFVPFGSTVKAAIDAYGACVQ